MNVDTDRLANEYIQHHQDGKYNIVPILPTSGIQLHMEGGTVTYQFKQTIMQARPKLNHQKYLCDKKQWKQVNFDSINWESHRRALNNLQARRTILIKYLNDITPVGKVVNMYDPKYPTNCPSCLEAVKTQDHMLQCPCPNRQVWRDSLLKAITAVISITPGRHSTHVGRHQLLNRPTEHNDPDSFTGSSSNCW
jgi:hypothetical protein